MYIYNFIYIHLLGPLGPLERSGHSRRTSSNWHGQLWQVFRPGIHDSGHVPRPSGQLPEDETRATGTTCRWGWSSYWWIVMGGMGWLGKSMVSGFDFPNKTNPRMGWFPLKPLSTSQSQHQSDAHLQQHRLGAYSLFHALYRCRGHALLKMLKISGNPKREKMDTMVSDG